MSGAARTFVLVTLAWVLALAVVVALGLLVGAFVPGPVASIGAPLVLGWSMAIVQRRVFGLSAESRWLEPATALGALLGFWLGTIAVWKLSLAPAEIPAGCVRGLVLGTAIGSLQALTLRRSVRARAAWIAMSALGWALAVGPLFPVHVSPLVRTMALTVPGLLAVVLRRRSRFTHHVCPVRPPSLAPAD